MQLVHTTTYSAEKTTAGEICRDYGRLQNKHFQFYDPKDDTISWMVKDGISNWDWMSHQKPKRIIYLVEEVKDYIKLLGENK